MTELKAFDFNSNAITVLTINGEPWFVASEICYVLEVDVNDSIKRLDEDEKISTESTRITEVEQIKSKWLVSESGLYSLVLGSRKPIAKPFKKWVTSEVLPSIRKTGSYSLQQLTPGQLLKLQAEALISVELKQQKQEQQLLKHDSRLSTIEERFQKADEVLKQLPPATTEVPTKSVRSCVNEVLRSYSYRTGDAYQSLWNVLYKEYKYRYHVDLKTRAKNEELKTLDYAEQFGVIDKVYALALELFGKD